MFNTERIFITGICGFIGRNLAAEAARNGYEVSGADIKVRDVPGAKVINADIRDRDRMLGLTKGADYIVHLAAVTSNLEFERRMPYSYEVNVNGFNSIIEAAYANKCRKFLYASSSAVYYNNAFSETSALNPDEMTNHYAKTKLINDMIAKSYTSCNLLDAVGMRFFNVYGPGENEKGDYASIITLFTKMKKAGKPIAIYGDGRQARDLIYIQDAAKIILLLMKKSGKNLYNVGTGKATSYNEIADMMGGSREYVKNPLSSYQLFTKADNSRLLDEIGSFKFTDIKDYIKTLV